MNGRFRAAAGAVAVPALLVFVLLAVGCKPFSGPLPGDPTPEPYFIQHLSGEGSFPLGLDLGDTTRDVYFTFVNANLFSTSGSITVSGGAASEVPEAGMSTARIATTAAVPAASTSRRAPTPESITAFNQDPFGARGRPAPLLRQLERPPAPPSFDTKDVSTGIFHNFDSSTVPATCREVIGPISIAGGGTRTLNIWVADDCWDATAPVWRTYRVTSGMLTELAGQFLKASLDNDIYDWVTAMLGPEWGPHGFGDLIVADDEITIVLCDINNDDSEGGYVGYFWAGDNFKSLYVADSSERVMFTIDAVMYAIDTNSYGYPDSPGWNPTDFWQEEIFSTLAHEFQHMIHFYQREVLRDATAPGDTWINEMASQVVEDLLADKMDVLGPRGVDGDDGTAGAPGNSSDRLARFNENNAVSLSDWGGSGDLESYSVSYAFGAWLARNYGGAMLLNRLMKCPLTGTSSIEYIVFQATGHAEYFPRLLQRWGAAQLLSDKTDAPPGYRYNSGGFVQSTVGGHDYFLGSINLFNYDYYGQIGPRVYYGTGTVGTSQHLSTSATLYQAATSATGSLKWTLDMPPGLIASVIVK